MKKLIFCLFLLSLMLPVFSQTEAPGLDSVLLKSGVVYTGTIKDYQKGKFVQIKLENGEEIIIGAIDVAQVIQNSGKEEEEVLFQVDENLAEDWDPKKEEIINDQGIIDEVYLHDGSIIRGKITEYVQGESLTIQLKNGGSLVFADEEIKSIKQVTTEEQITRGRKRVKKNRPYEFREKGFYSTVYMEMVNGRLDNSFPRRIGAASNSRISNKSIGWFGSRGRDIGIVLASW